MKKIKDILKVGELVKWNGDTSGRIDKVTKVVKGMWGGLEYHTQETNPPKGQEPKIGKQFFDATGECEYKKVGIIRA